MRASARVEEEPYADSNGRCNTPVGCEDRAGNVVDVGGGQKQSCAWVEGAWLARCAAYPDALTSCPVVCGACTCSDKPKVVVDLSGDGVATTACKKLSLSKCTQGNAALMCPITCDAC